MPNNKPQKKPSRETHEATQTLEEWQEDGGLTDNDYAWLKFARGVLEKRDADLCWYLSDQNLGGRKVFGHRDLSR